MGTNKHVVAKRNPLVNRREVLDLAPITDHDLSIDVGVLANSAESSQSRSFPNLNPMPHYGSIAYCRIFGNDGSWVDS